MSESKQIVRFGGDQQPKSVAGTALLSKLFDLLDIIGRDPGSVTIAELSEATNWPRATLYRILAAATAMGYVRQDRRGHSYALGFRFIELAQNVWSCTNIVTAGSGELRRLRDITGETAYLAIYHDTATLTVGRFESAAVLASRTAGRAPTAACEQSGQGHPFSSAAIRSCGAARQAAARTLHTADGDRSRKADRATRG